MITIELKNTLENRSYPEAGEVVYNILKDAIDRDEKIIIDMQDIISVPTMFMNTSFGVFIDNYGADKLKKTISFRNILKSQAERIQTYIKEYENMIKHKNEE